MKVYIFLHSGISKRDFYYEHFQRTRKEGDIIICADGGYAVAESLGLRPQYVIGDMDSFDDGKVYKGTEIIKFPDEKDYSDFELAMKKSVEFQPRNITVYGALGGRKDHEITNILVLAFAKAPTVFIEEEVEIFNVIGFLSLIGKKGLTCSLLPFGGSSFVTDMRGFRYILQKEELKPSSRGLSNIITDDEAYIRISKGNLVVIVNMR